MVCVRLATGLALVLLSVNGAVAAVPLQCKKKCNDAYAACLASRPEEACRMAWLSCKKTCAPATPGPTAPPSVAPRPGHP